MDQYFCDGSSRGLGIGAGVVVINESMFIDTYAFHALHLEASGLISEQFAILKALEMAMEKDTREVIIYTDLHANIHQFSHEVQQSVPLFYTAENKVTDFGLIVRNRIKDMTLNGYHIQIELYDKSSRIHTVMMKMAHSLSRDYFKRLIPIALDSATFSQEQLLPPESTFRHLITLTSHSLQQLLLKTSKEPMVRVSVRKVNKRWVAYIKNKKYYEHTKLSRLCFLVLIDLFTMQSDVQIQINQTVAETLRRSPNKSKEVRWIRNLFDTAQIGTYPDLSVVKRSDISA